MRARLGTLAALLVLPAGAAAQTPGLGAGALVQSYRFDDPGAAGLARFRLTTLPFAASVPLASRISVEASGAWAEGLATGPDGAEADLSGPTDTQIGLSVALGTDRVVLTAGASVPSGSSTHTLEQAAVAGVIAAELLPFAISTWGSGGSTSGDLAMAFQHGRLGIGLSAGYEAARGWEPLADKPFVYRPGNQMRARVAMDADVGESSTVSLLVGFQRFGSDEAGDANLFQAGDRLEGLLSWAFPLGVRGSALLYGGVSHRANGTVLVEDPLLEGAGDSPAQQLFLGGSNARLPLGGRVTVLPDAELRVFRSEDGVGQGWVGTAGASMDLRVGGTRWGRRLVLGPTARVRYGHVVVREGSTSDLTGWEAGVTLRMESGR